MSCLYILNDHYIWSLVTGKGTLCAGMAKRIQMLTSWDLKCKWGNLLRSTKIFEANDNAKVSLFDIAGEEIVAPGEVDRF